MQGEFGEIEHYLFYRGLGHFDIPVETRFDAAGQLVLANREPAHVPFVFVYDKRSDHDVRVAWLGNLAGGEEKVVSLYQPVRGLEAAEPEIRATFQQALTAQGLFPDEAAAMLETWWHSYFMKDGLRVFWIVPRSFTEQVLPLQIDPAPSELVRVMVGRSEVLTPAFERSLAGPGKDTANLLYQDRFWPAYQARAKALSRP
jgi:hypothetical protein